MHVILIACLISLVGSVFADNFQEPLRSPPTSHPRPHRIAVIGAGPGGSATSYYLDKFARSSSLDRRLEVTVFDSNTYIGGRTTTVNALDDPRYPTELGASIFVKINHILYNATRDFGLIPSAKIYQAAPDSKYELGIWDGSSFVFTSATDDDNSSWSGWWDIAKLLWKYGLSPIRTQRATRKAVGSFLEFYNEPLFPFPSIQEAVLSTGLDAYTSVTGKDVLHSAGVGDLFSREIIQASTRVNYASNLGGIHGLETLVCMAIEGAVAVEGGNWQIFEGMVTSSATRLLLNTTVTDVVKDTEHGTFTIQTTNPDINEFLGTEDDAAYDTVVLAAPYQFANITFTPPLANPPSKIPYVSLYVTLFTSPHCLSPSFFGLTEQADVPPSVLTTLHEGLDQDLTSRRGVDAVGPAGFWSISTLRVLRPDTDGTFFGPTSNNSQSTDSQPQYLYKIFSPAPLTGSFLSNLLDFPHTSVEKDDPLSTLSKKDVTWLHEKLWHSYPYESPRSTFENFTLLTTSGDEQERDEGLFYLSGMESFISTMETSALAGMNVAKLIVDQLQSQS
ncbi:hypothetical protein LTR10_020942 [Elasticomyces elasticus]|uniref:Prenylcysteine lyase domain-containing protein n=1 Tax=Exophiala sideris TaxID=1016849 RepID=A0ABR0JC91_9EURO|nr:hypothetical protein LTR10_020942 [Elasticomyces elasticus]KAK5031099.1 hypothetical protein LTS07_004834 [Exophiala sideris]KAK5038821.1 hypothetical protein LTR13_003852 [Exophiala sideris]KAK5060704.1 hypothetical protein LTR69_005303 [Exophiala sideris]KAK5183617.1 hypothetical protein LTR44_003899 [Eurotiomycetes sp. CCFEE 6388]